MRFFGKLCKGLMMLALVAVLSVLLGFVVEHLWNWLMPAILGLHTITYWQAVGLFLLSKILMGGIHRHGGRDQRGHWAWKQRMKERWMQMSPEERERFRAGMSGRRGCHWSREDKEQFREAVRARWGHRPDSGEPAKENV
jgi:hypothetical protein